jgi:peptidoglycan/LPS O-acetylase OafA/YrhL
VSKSDTPGWTVTSPASVAQSPVPLATPQHQSLPPPAPEKTVGLTAAARQYQPSPYFAWHGPVLVFAIVWLAFMLYRYRKQLRKPFAVICLLLGVAFIVATLSVIVHPSYDDVPAPILGVVATAFLLGSFALLRQRQKTPSHAAIISDDSK